MTRTHRAKPATDDPDRLRLSDPPPAAGHIIEPLMSLDDLAAILKCSRRLVERMRSASKLPRPDIQIGKMPRWKPETIRRWIEQGGGCQ